MLWGWRARATFAAEDDDAVHVPGGETLPVAQNHCSGFAPLGFPNIA
jgi:hypothetical protein